MRSTFLWTAVNLRNALDIGERARCDVFKMGYSRSMYVAVPAGGVQQASRCTTVAVGEAPPCSPREVAIAVGVPYASLMHFLAVYHSYGTLNY